MKLLRIQIALLVQLFILLPSLTLAAVAKNIKTGPFHRRQIESSVPVPSATPISSPGNTVASQKFNDGSPQRLGEVLDAKGSNYCTGIYGVNNDGDIPFARANRGKLMFYGKGEGNTPDGVSDKWIDQGGVDDPKQSACGIPHNAYYISHVAIHPYWLRYAKLDRYCMPDVCISFFSTDWSTDMMLKVTDICSTDVCKTPGDIKIDRTKAKIWSHQGTDPRPAEEIPGLGGDSFDQETIWFFRPCWDDGMLQDPYDHDGNWFATPKFYNNKEQTADYSISQYKVNQVRYPPGLQYNQCQYNTSCQGDPIPDANAPIPAWEPICGGLGFSGTHTAPGTQCPGYSGRSGTPDTRGTQQEIDQCNAVGDAAGSGPQGSYKVGELAGSGLSGINSTTNNGTLGNGGPAPGTTSGGTGNDVVFS